MAAPVIAAIGAGGLAAGAGSIVGGALASRGAKDAARAGAAASDAATAEQQRQYDLGRQDLAPYRQIGTQALNQLGSLYGFTPYQEPQQAPSASGAAPQFRNVGGRLVPTGATYRMADLGTDWMAGGPAGSAGDNILNRFAAGVVGGPIKPPVTTPPNGLAQPQGMAGFWASPDYNFRRTEGLRGIEQSAAARGGALSGNALRATTGFASDLASQEFGNYYNRLASLANIGQTATNSGVMAGQRASENIQNNMMNAGAARASGIVNSANAWGNTLGDIGYILGRRFG